MDLQEQIFRSRQLMCESDDDRLTLINDILNDTISFNGNIQYNAVKELEDWNDGNFYFSVEVTIDSSMYHKVSPNFDFNYQKYVTNIDTHIHTVVKNYLPPNFKFEVSAFLHKNVDIVVKSAKPLLDKAFKVYNQKYFLPILPYEFITVFPRQEIVILIESKENVGLRFNHSDFMETLSILYPSTRDSLFSYVPSLFNDFYITASSVLKINQPNFKLHGVTESIVNNKVVCDNCGWSWELSDGGDDPYTCHKCGQDNLDS